MLHRTEPSTITERTIRLQDGRNLGYAEFGCSDGLPLLYFHGHPGSRMEARFLEEQAQRLGVRLIGIDRPGLGLSTYQPRRRLLDWPGDVLQLADHLEIERFGVVGFSGGGPYALACARQIPGRLTACGVVGGVGQVNPFTALFFEWLPWFLLPVSRGFMRDEEQAQKVVLLGAKSWDAMDRRSVVAPGIKELLAVTLREAMRQGARGAADDGALFGRPWGFSIEDIRFQPVFLWHGEADKEVAVRVAREMAAKLPGCQAAYYPGEGHISLIVNRAAHIVTALRETYGNV